MYCEFQSGCLSCGEPIIISIELPSGATELPDGRYFECPCSCGAYPHAGAVPEIRPIEYRSRRSPNSVEGRLV